MKQRNDVIDIFRAVAVFLVTGFHLFLWSSSQGFKLPFGFDAMGVFGNGWVGVGMFFVISGYCMAGATAKTFKNGINKENYVLYFSKRFLRISIPYYISIVIWFVLINKYGIAIKSTDLIDVISHVTYVHNLSPNTFFSISGVYWSLAVEMQFYLVLPVVIVVFDSVFLRVILLLLSAAVSVFVNTYGFGQLVTWGMPTYFYLFVLGWVVALYSSEISAVLNKYKLVLPIGAFFVLGLFYKGDGFNNHIKMYEIIMSTLFAFFMVAVVHVFDDSDTPPIMKMMSYIGKCSFSIYF